MLSFNLVFFGDTSFFGVLKILAIWVTYLAFFKFCEIFFLDFLHCNVVESVGIVIQGFKTGGNVQEQTAYFKISF